MKWLDEIEKRIKEVNAHGGVVARAFQAHEDRKRLFAALKKAIKILKIIKEYPGQEDAEWAKGLLKELEEME